MRLQILYVRSQSLKDEVRLLKEKEAKDTKALDDMVQKIEENLKIATVSMQLSCQLIYCGFTSNAQSLLMQL